MPISLVQKRPIQATVINLLLLVCLALLLTGIFAPLITLEKFYFFKNQVSLFSGLLELHAKGEWLILVIISVFSVFFPIAKLFLLGAALNIPGDRHHGPLRWLEAFGKWSMLDVFVVALLVVSVKFKGLAEVEVHYGAYAFAGSVLLTMLLVQWVHWLTLRSNRKS